MKEEFLEVYSPEGTKTGQKKSKSEIHRKGLFHSTVHVWIFTDEGNILIQKRSKKKELNPGVWDVSVAGHIKFNENIKKAAKRETLEETGININTKDLLKIGLELCCCWGQSELKLCRFLRSASGSSRKIIEIDWLHCVIKYIAMLLVVVGSSDAKGNSGII